MSIAVSAVIRPSRLMLALVALFSTVLFASAVVLCCRLAGKIPDLSRVMLSLLCVSAACSLFFIACRRKKSYRLDISGNGQIRLSEYRPTAVASSVDRCTDIDGSSEVVHLLKDSTLWPKLLLLRLQSQAGCVTTVPIFFDSTERRAFRAVCVACHWIAAQNTRPAAKKSDTNSLVD